MSNASYCLVSCGRHQSVGGTASSCFCDVMTRWRIALLGFLALRALDINSRHRLLILSGLPSRITGLFIGFFHAVRFSFLLLLFADFSVQFRACQFLQGVSVALSPVLAIVGKPSVRLSVCPSVCPSHAGTE